jgi:ADP-ribose pyrophosphatase YjhB (NUDIX family)
MKPDKSFYQSLPAKRMAAGCLFFNSEKQVMLVKPTYKPTWEIPGGITELNESPKLCCQREVSEELGLNPSVTS